MVLFDKDGYHGAEGRRSAEQAQEFEGKRASNPVPIRRHHRDILVTVNGRKGGGLLGKVPAARQGERSIIRFHGDEIAELLHVARQAMKHGGRERDDGLVLKFGNLDILGIELQEG